MCANKAKTTQQKIERKFNSPQNLSRQRDCPVNVDKLITVLS